MLIIWALQTSYLDALATEQCRPDSLECSVLSLQFRRWPVKWRSKLLTIIYVIKWTLAFSLWSFPTDNPPHETKRSYPGPSIALNTIPFAIKTHWRLHMSTRPIDIRRPSYIRLTDSRTTVRNSKICRPQPLLGQLSAWKRTNDTLLSCSTSTSNQKDKSHSFKFSSFHFLRCSVSPHDQGCQHSRQVSKAVRSLSSHNALSSSASFQH